MSNVLTCLLSGFLIGHGIADVAAGHPSGILAIAVGLVGFCLYLGHLIGSKSA